jgi:uncharacterized membrane protein YtjA (UPF0391 family)
VRFPEDGRPEEADRRKSQLEAEGSLYFRRSTSPKGTLAQTLRFHLDASEEFPMLRWAVIFLVIGLIAALLGFTNVAGVSFDIARILFFIFIAVFLVLLVLGLTAARKLTGG